MTYKSIHNFQLGQYLPLKTMTFDEQEQITKEFMLFDEPMSNVISSTRMSRDWPDARGIWKNSDNSFLIWVNEEDHCRFVAMEKGGNMNAVFNRICKYLELFEAAMKSKGQCFMWNKHLGYLVTSPQNVGTCLRASVQISLPLLSKHLLFEDLLRNLKLEKSDSNDIDNAPGADAIYDISNKDRLKYSEVRFPSLLSILLYQYPSLFTITIFIFTIF